MKTMGWIKLHREIQDHWVFQDPVKFHRWVTLLLLARHDSKPYKVNIGNTLYECQRGQHITSLQKLSDLWKCSRSSTKHFLQLLQKDNMIVLDLHTVCTQITICNYDTYQPSTNSLQTDEKHLRNTCETEGNTNKNDKKENNEKKERDIPVSDETVFTTSTIFEQPHELKTDEATTKQKKETPPPSSGAPPPLKFDFRQKLIDYGFNEKLVDDWLKVRKSKKAVNTETAYKLFIKQIELAKKDKNKLLEYIISKSWQGFTADWLNNNNNFIHEPKQQQPQRDYLDPSYGKYV